MNEIARAIGKFLAQADQSFAAYLAALAAIGILTMALIQAAKDTLPLRRWYQGFRLNRWLEAGAAEAAERFPESTSPAAGGAPNPEQARATLVRLSVDGDEPALLDLSIEQLCGQMIQAMQMVIEYPKAYRDLFLVTASMADPADVKVLLTVNRAALGLSSGGGDRAEYTDARNRVMHQLQRAVDGFQIATGYRWKLWLQIASFLVSAGLAAVAVAAAQNLSGLGTRFGLVVVTAILAGFLAPVARDLTAALQRLRAG